MWDPLERNAMRKISDVQVSGILALTFNPVHFQQRV